MLSFLRVLLNIAVWVISRIPPEQWAKLGPLAANMNQIARGLNAGDMFTVSDAVAIDEMRQHLAAIRLALTGEPT